MAPTTAMAMIIATITIVCLAYHNRALQKRIATDEVTGDLSKDGINDKVRPLLAHIMRSGETLSYLYLDLKHFKAINDQIGREEADEVLRIVARQINARLRQDTIFGRYTGDEYVFVMPAGVEDIAGVINRVIVPALEAANCVIEQNGWPCISGRIGVATFSRGSLYGNWWNSTCGLTDQAFHCEEVISHDVRKVMKQMLALAHKAMEKAK